MEISFLKFAIIDWGLLVFAILIFVLGLARGLGKSIVSLLIWASALVFSQIISILLSAPLSAYIYDQELLLLLPFSISFFFMMIVLNLLFSLLSVNTGSSPIVRLLGGLVAIPLIVVQLLVIVNFCRLLTIDDSNYWLDSQLIPIILEMEFYWRSLVLDNVCFSLPGVKCFPY